jgi:hypothetical protein
MSVPVESQILSFNGVPTRAGSLYYTALRTVDTETDTNRVNTQFPSFSHPWTL